MRTFVKVFLFAGSLLFGDIVLAQDVADSPKSLAEKQAERRDQEANRQLEVVLQKMGTSNVNSELAYRLDHLARLEATLITRLNTPSVTKEGEECRRLAAKLLGRLHSHKGVPALVDSLLLSNDIIAGSSDVMLGMIRLTYPCARALIEIGLSAEPLIIDRIAKNNKLSKDRIEMAAYCLLMIHNDSTNIPHVDETDRAMLLSRIERAGSKPDANKEGLNQLRAAVQQIDVAKYEGPNVRPDGR